MAATQIKNGFAGGTDDQLLVLPDGSINVNTTGGGGSPNVNLHDGSGNPISSTGTSLNVNVTGTIAGGATPVLVYNEVTGVAMGASQIVSTYTVPIGKTLVLSRIDSSSDSISVLEVQFDSVTNAKRRLYYTGFNTDFDFSSGFSLSAGMIVTVLATNESTAGVAAFNATIIGVLE